MQQLYTFSLKKTGLHDVIWGPENAVGMEVFSGVEPEVKPQLPACENRPISRPVYINISL